MKDYINKMNQIDRDMKSDSDRGMNILAGFVVAMGVLGVFAYAFKGVM